MSISRPALAVAVALSLAPAVARSEDPAGEPAPPAPSGPMRVTTDTREYCDSLAQRVTQAESKQANTPPPQVEELAEEGHHMCTNGLVRGGLVRLRRALMLLQGAK